MVMMCVLDGRLVISRSDCVRAGLEAVGLVHGHNFGNDLKVIRRSEIWCKKAALWSWVVAPITMAAAPADNAGGAFGCVAALSTRTTTAEVRFCHRSPRSL